MEISSAPTNGAYSNIKTYSPANQVAWFGFGSLVAFALPFVGSSVLELQHDLYLLFYGVGVTALLYSYVRATDVDVGALFRRNWIPSLAIGVVLAVLLIFNVLSEDATERPDGIYFAFELFWRGAVYGSIDALLLTVFPCVVVLSILGGRLLTVRRKLLYFFVSLALVLTITAIYHLGYDQYRQDGVRGPEIGNTLISLPMLLTANPVGSVVDHAAMHMAAVAHEYETELRLPPQVEVE